MPENQEIRGKSNLTIAGYDPLFLFGPAIFGALVGSVVSKNGFLVGGLLGAGLTAAFHLTLKYSPGPRLFNQS